MSHLIARSIIGLKCFRSEPAEQPPVDIAAPTEPLCREPHAADADAADDAPKAKRASDRERERVERTRYTTPAELTSITEIEQ